MLSKNEAIALSLYFSKDNRIGSQTKLNKIVAFLNVVSIPVNVIFVLNKNGSYSKDLTEDTGSILSVYKYNYEGKKGIAFNLTEYGRKLAKDIFNKKILMLFDDQEIINLKEKIKYFNELDSQSLSQFEHTKLKVNIDDRFKLKQDSNSINIDYLDIHKNLSKINSDNFSIIDLKGISQFYFYLSSFLRKSFNRLDDVYDYGAPMVNYYLLFVLQEQIELFQSPLSDLISDKNKKLFKLNRNYNAVQELINIYNFPFDLENSNLREIVSATEN